MNESKRLKLLSQIIEEQVKINSDQRKYDEGVFLMIEQLTTALKLQEQRISELENAVKWFPKG
jgi:F0F1-type ATP synthase delta subunit